MSAELSIPSHSSRVHLLVNQEESATLEFKREWYRLEANPKERQRQKDELIKDILALANGNVYSMADVAFLVVGVGDERDQDGNRTLHDVGEATPRPEHIIQLVASASDPPIQNIAVIPFSHEDVRLFAIAVPPTPHLHETTRQLSPSRKSYSEHTVFIRRGPTVDIASARERKAIEKLKELRFSERTIAPPIVLGAGIGATIATGLFVRLGRRITGHKEGALAGLLVGPIIGGAFGAIVGATYEGVLGLAKTRPSASVRTHSIALAATGIISVSLWLLMQDITDRFSPPARPSPSNREGKPGA